MGGTASPNDQRSAVKNPGTPGFEAAKDIRSRQLNPQSQGRKK
jgi:hypothetical protein